jgi:hypothetical protein
LQVERFARLHDPENALGPPALADSAPLATEARRSNPAGKIGKIERELMARHRPKLADRSAPGSGHGDAGRNRS